MEYLIFIVIGFCISILSGFFGIGGGFILTPFLMLFGYSPLEAIATSLMFSIGTSLAGVYAHYKMKNIRWKEVAILASSGVIATQVAYPFVKWLEHVALDTVVIPALYLLLLSYFAFKMLSKEKSYVSMDAQNQEKQGTPIFLLICIGFFAGFLSTALGVGGGFILVPLLIAFLRFESKHAVATSLASIIFIVSAGFTTFAVQNPMNFSIGILLIAGAVIGAPLGAKATSFVKSRMIQVLLGLLYITTMTSLVFKMVNWDEAGFIVLIVYTLAVNSFVFIKFFQRKAVVSH
ncbi:MULTISPECIES: sulfite exporter TauE/SafE family protein [Bacillus]|uniref:sulfite exporter TauE/SafE family protein n=1 Tax=Bacillus TaxID=1386 RepID=UPI000BB7DB35|nr:MULTISPECIES: sulfite exporter TauE/SafE family protein [Bacillus]